MLSSFRFNYQENHEIRESKHLEWMSYMKSLEIDTIFRFKSKHLKTLFILNNYINLVKSKIN